MSTAIEIPYYSTERPDTGLYNAKLGVWLFLASEVMLFGALFSAYVLLRVGAPAGEWPHGWLNVTLGTINTLVLATSAITPRPNWAGRPVTFIDVWMRTWVPSPDGSSVARMAADAVPAPRVWSPI